MIKLFVVTSRTVRHFIRIQIFLRKCLSAPLHARFVGSLWQWQLLYTVRVCFHKINTKNSDMDICFILLCAKLCTTEPYLFHPSTDCSSVLQLELNSRYAREYVV